MKNLSKLMPPAVLLSILILTSCAGNPVNETENSLPPEFPTLTWQNYTFKRPAGMDWFFYENAAGKHLEFLPDDGDSLDNETWAPNDTSDPMSGGIYLEVLFTDNFGKIEREGAKYYKEANFNGIIYEISRYVENDKEYVEYKSKVGGEYLHITALKEYDSPAQNILNKIIGI